MPEQQSAASVEANARYFSDHLREYGRAIAEFETSRRIRSFVSERVRGVGHLLDVGNGGVFCYDTRSIEKITAVDLFLDQLPPDIVAQYIPRNATAKQGSALALPELDASCDMVLMVMVLHHLAGRHWRESWENVRVALREATRVLRPGGRLLVVESCVPRWFFEIEKPAFRVLSAATSSVLSHPVTIQFPVGMIATELEGLGGNVQVTEIPKGRFVLQFGIKWPSCLTPVQPYALEVTKPTECAT
jgi:ubiquinone/menaquinone biosynthesis C-methylase UbiE